MKTPAGMKRICGRLIGTCARCGARNTLSIHIERRLWHCFRCKAGGRIEREGEAI